ncbi:MAG: DnaA regulatory inactivator Hda [Thiothrix sp.]|nr:DnaA regulatory inactivator Hda [Thiothrix sp.]HPQ95073.1 DnaA regulatory inactivator Hda [Thiolinea sp.]
MMQLALSIGLNDGFEFDSFYPKRGNEDLLALLNAPFWNTWPQIFLHGSSASGKSHLLQASACLAQLQGERVSYLPLRELRRYGTGVLEGLENTRLLALDDIDAVMGEPAWEEALFHLINQRRQDSQSTLLSATLNPHQLESRLPDLASRLLWGPIYRLHALDEAEALETFRLRALKRGFELPDYLLRYIHRHFPRDIRSMMQLLERLDATSRTSGRRITRNLVQEMAPAAGHHQPG